MQFQKIISELRRNGNPSNREGMARFAITAEKAYGTGVPFVRKLSRQIRSEIKGDDELNHLAKKLWEHGAHESKLLATMAASPSIGWKTAEGWISDCQNWAEVDQLCMNLLWRMDGAPDKALLFSKSGEEWRKRTGFSLIAVFAWREKGRLNSKIAGKFLSAIERESTDGRNFVKKAVNWALRHIGKFGAPAQHRRAILLSKKLSSSKNKAARWIGSDALRELASPRVCAMAGQKIQPRLPAPRSGSPPAPP